MDTDSISSDYHSMEDTALNNDGNVGNVDGVLTYDTLSPAPKIVWLTWLKRVGILFGMVVVFYIIALAVVLLSVVNMSSNMTYHINQLKISDICHLENFTLTANFNVYNPTLLTINIDTAVVQIISSSYGPLAQAKAENFHLHRGQWNNYEFTANLIVDAEILRKEIERTANNQSDLIVSVHIKGSTDSILFPVVVNEKFQTPLTFAENTHNRTTEIASITFEENGSLNARVVIKNLDASIPSYLWLDLKEMPFIIKADNGEIARLNIPKQIVYGNAEEYLTLDVQLSPKDVPNVRSMAEKMMNSETVTFEIDFPKNECAFERLFPVVYSTDGSISLAGEPLIRHQNQTNDPAPATHPLLAANIALEDLWKTGTNYSARIGLEITQEYLESKIGSSTPIDIYGKLPELKLHVVSGADTMFEVYVHSDPSRQVKQLLYYIDITAINFVDSFIYNPKNLSALRIVSENGFSIVSDILSGIDLQAVRNFMTPAKVKAMDDGVPSVDYFLKMNANSDSDNIGLDVALSMPKSPLDITKSRTRFSWPSIYIETGKKYSDRSFSKIADFNISSGAFDYAFSQSKYTSMYAFCNGSLNAHVNLEAPMDKSQVSSGSSISELRNLILDLFEKNEMRSVYVDVKFGDREVLNLNGDYRGKPKAQVTQVKTGASSYYARYNPLKEIELLGLAANKLYIGFEVSETIFKLPPVNYTNHVPIMLNLELSTPSLDLYLHREDALAPGDSAGGIHVLPVHGTIVVPIYHSVDQIVKPVVNITLGRSVETGVRIPSNTMVLELEILNSDLLIQTVQDTLYFSKYVNAIQSQQSAVPKTSTVSISDDSNVSVEAVVNVAFDKAPNRSQNFLSRLITYVMHQHGVFTYGSPIMRNRESPQALSSLPDPNTSAIDFIKLLNDDQNGNGQLNISTGLLSTKAHEFAFFVNLTLPEAQNDMNGTLNNDEEASVWNEPFFVKWGEISLDLSTQNSSLLQVHLSETRLALSKAMDAIPNILGAEDEISTQLSFVVKFLGSSTTNSGLPIALEDLLTNKTTINESNFTISAKIANYKESNGGNTEDLQISGSQINDAILIFSNRSFVPFKNLDAASREYYAQYDEWYNAQMKESAKGSESFLFPIKEVLFNPKGASEQTIPCILPNMCILRNETYAPMDFGVDVRVAGILKSIQKALVSSMRQVLKLLYFYRTPRFVTVRFDVNPFGYVLRLGKLEILDVSFSLPRFTLTNIDIFSDDIAPRDDLVFAFDASTKNMRALSSFMSSNFVNIAMSNVTLSTLLPTSLVPKNGFHTELIASKRGSFFEELTSHLVASLSSSNGQTSDQNSSSKSDALRFQTENDGKTFEVITKTNFSLPVDMNITPIRLYIVHNDAVVFDSHLLITSNRTQYTLTTISRAHNEQFELDDFVRKAGRMEETPFKVRLEFVNRVNYTLNAIIPSRRFLDMPAPKPISDLRLPSILPKTGRQFFEGFSIDAFDSILESIETFSARVKLHVFFDDITPLGYRLNRLKLGLKIKKRLQGLLTNNLQEEIDIGTDYFSRVCYSRETKKLNHKCIMKGYKPVFEMMPNETKTLSVPLKARNIGDIASQLMYDGKLCADASGIVNLQVVVPGDKPFPIEFEFAAPYAPLKGNQPCYSESLCYSTSKLLNEEITVHGPFIGGMKDVLNGSTKNFPTTMNSLESFVIQFKATFNDRSLLRLTLGTEKLNSLVIELSSEKLKLSGTSKVILDQYFKKTSTVLNAYIKVSPFGLMIKIFDDDDVSAVFIIRDFILRDEVNRERIQISLSSEKLVAVEGFSVETITPSKLLSRLVSRNATEVVQMLDQYTHYYQLVSRCGDPLFIDSKYLTFALADSDASQMVTIQHTHLGDDDPKYHGVYAFQEHTFPNPFLYFCILNECNLVGSID